MHAKRLSRVHSLTPAAMAADASTGFIDDSLLLDGQQNCPEPPPPARFQDAPAFLSGFLAKSQTHGLSFWQ
jgi:hypothetical protein